MQGHSNILQHARRTIYKRDVHHEPVGCRALRSALYGSVPVPVSRQTDRASGTVGGYPQSLAHPIPFRRESSCSFSQGSPKIVNRAMTTIPLSPTAYSNDSELPPQPDSFNDHNLSPSPSSSSDNLAEQHSLHSRPSIRNSSGRASLRLPSRTSIQTLNEPDQDKLSCDTQSLMNNVSSEDLDVLSSPTLSSPLQVFPLAVHSGILNREADDHDTSSSPPDRKVSVLQPSGVPVLPLSSPIFIKSDAVQTPDPVIPGL